jgi:DNA gyrase subunit A
LLFCQKIPLPVGIILGDGYLSGRVKRLSLADLSSVRVSGLIALTLDEGDELGWARLTSGKDELILVTSGGYALRMHESDIRVMGRGARGVGGIKLNPGDRLTSLEVAVPGASLLVVTEKGYGKRTPLTQYRVQGRATRGVTTIDIKSLSIIGRVASARVVEKGDQITLISNSGIMLRVNVDDIKSAGRATRGVRIMHMEKGDNLASIGRISDSKKEA